MANIAIASWAVCFLAGIVIIVVSERKARKEKLNRDTIQSRINLAEKHIEYSKDLFKCFEETKDLNYLDYANEELEKAQKLIDENNKIADRLRL